MITLKDLCLNIIVQEFQKFHFAFTKSKDEALQGNFKFLQRFYSFQILSQLFKKEKLKDEYMELLIDERLQFFDGEWLDNTCLISILCRLPKLEIASLSKQCCDEILEAISKYCPNLTEIDITHSSVTDKGIKYLCKDVNGIIPCPNLKNMFIEGTRITNEGVKYLLQSLPSLENLYCSNVPEILYSLHEKDLPKLEKVRSYNLVNLTLLKLNGLSYYADLLKICLNVCPRLKSISCSITNTDELNLFSNNRLESIHIKFPKTDPKINVSNFLRDNGYNLTSLKIYSCTMCIRSLAESCPKLKQLHVSNVTFLEEYDLPAAFLNLVECTFQNSKEENLMGKATSVLLLSSPKLESVLFKDCVLSLDIKSHVLKCCEDQHVKQITFKDSILEMHFIREILSSSPPLFTLNLLNCPLGEQDEKELYEIVKILPNKPCIYCCDLLDFSDIDSEEESSDSFDNSEESSEHDID